MPFIIILVFYILCSWVVAYCGRYRLFGFWGYFFASLLLTPLLGLLFVIASSGSDRYLVTMSRAELEELRAKPRLASTAEHPADPQEAATSVAS